VRTKISMMLALTALTLLAPTAAATTTRSADLKYIIPNGLNTEYYRTGWTIFAVRPEMTIPLQDDETTVSITVDDVTGADVYVGVVYDMTIAAMFCTETDEPFEVPAG
jgi:hypothetical protein